jgi:hypothetical protein
MEQDQQAADRVQEEGPAAEQAEEDGQEAEGPEQVREATVFVRIAAINGPISRENPVTVWSVPNAARR